MHLSYNSYYVAFIGVNCACKSCNNQCLKGFISNTIENNHLIKFNEIWGVSFKCEWTTLTISLKELLLKKYQSQPTKDYQKELPTQKKYKKIIIMVTSRIN